jgi:hypothetical protein
MTCNTSFSPEDPVAKGEHLKKIASGGVPSSLGGQWPRKRVARGYLS